ncbi:hypothetical protein, partial [Zhouia amylolytica]|uniref:hypothetical protein n=1 Tax=Zhouia amylolytica TaxID=376730 RepID=UPI0020CD81C2
SYNEIKSQFDEQKEKLKETMYEIHLQRAEISLNIGDSMLKSPLFMNPESFVKTYQNSLKGIVGCYEYAVENNDTESKESFEFSIKTGLKTIINIQNKSKKKIDIKYHSFQHNYKKIQEIDNQEIYNLVNTIYNNFNIIDNDNNS